AERSRLLAVLGDSGSKAAAELITAWTRDQVLLFEGPGGTKVPVILEEQQDADGKARAVTIADGRFLKDAEGTELRFSSDDLAAVDTDMRLRSELQQTLDKLALSDPDPDARRS